MLTPKELIGGEILGGGGALDAVLDAKLNSAAGGQADDDTTEELATEVEHNPFGGFRGVTRDVSGW
jgi:hypothetical protein